MEDPDASISPSSSRSVKITYKSRAKRKREQENDNDVESVGSIEASEIEGSPKRSKKLTDMGPPDSTKKLQFKVPEGPWKRQRCDSDMPDNVSVGSKAKKTHVRSSSSITSFKHIQSSSPAQAQKPASRSHKPSSSVSLKNPAPAQSESDFDDGASIAESFMSINKVRRTEAERIEYFNNQPEASNIEAHQVTCLRCKKTISLGKKQTYVVKPWETHRTRCDAKVPSGMFEQNTSSASKDNDNLSDGGATNTTMRPKTTEAERKAILENEALEVKPDEAQCKGCKKWIRLGSKSKYSLGNWTAHKLRCGGAPINPQTTEAERKAILEQEALEVKPDEAQCKRCKKWIRLGNTSKYSLGNWSTHQSRCGGVVPSSRVATAERKLRIVNDPKAKTFGPRHVECTACGKTVVLEGEADYTLTSWDNHKLECSDGEVSSPKTPEPRSVPRPPASVESSSTVVSPEGVEGSPERRGVKRRLEEDTEQSAETPVEEPPTNRPRTESNYLQDPSKPSVVSTVTVTKTSKRSAKARVTSSMIKAKVEEAIRLREEELKSDIYAKYIDPHNVWCTICDKNIKLSEKSLFDLSHWREHKVKKHRIRPNKPHTARGLISEARSDTPSDTSLDRKIPTIRLRKFPPPPSSDTSSQSSSVDTPAGGPRRSARTHKLAQRFNPLAASGSRNRSRDGTPFSSAPSSSASSSSSSSTLTSLALDHSSFSSVEDPQDGIIPLPVLPDLRLASEVEDYVKFRRWNCSASTVTDVAAQSESGLPPRWRDWSWSKLTLPRWCMPEDSEGSPVMSRATTESSFDSSPSEECECDLDDSDGDDAKSYMFFEQDSLDTQARAQAGSLLTVPPPTTD
ncbi:hypothetical protein V5O48_006688 [Marasmius crinis-equi]|uniref:Uncharacterized protein n=1 Tax=Marasmius crinis-equi TaxID=585013 RepID=A0ABR3FIV6_9AGAR